MDIIELRDLYRGETNDINFNTAKYADWLEQKLTSDNSDYAVPPSASPKVCPNCGGDESMYYNKNGRWYCDNCIMKGNGQTFA